MDLGEGGLIFLNLIYKPSDYSLFQYHIFQLRVWHIRVKSYSYLEAEVLGIGRTSLIKPILKPYTRQSFWPRSAYKGLVHKQLYLVLYSIYNLPFAACAWANVKISPVYNKYLTSSVFEKRRLGSVLTIPSAVTFAFSSMYANAVGWSRLTTTCAQKKLKKNLHHIGHTNLPMAESF